MSVKRILPWQVLPRQYPFLTRHSAKSFLTYTTYDFAAADFTRMLTVPHGLGYAPMHDMWVGKTTSVTGNAQLDFNFDLEPITHAPTQTFPVDAFGGLLDSYYLSADEENCYILIRHESASTGTYHVYFHVKLYMDNFFDRIYDGDRNITIA